MPRAADVKGGAPVPRGPAARLFLAILLCCLAGSASALVLDRSDRPYPLDDRLALLHDPGAELDLAGAREALARGQFQRPDRPTRNYGYVDGALWLHARLDNVSGQDEWLLVIEYMLLDHTEIHLLQGDRLLESHLGGDHLPFDARDLDLRFFNHVLDLPGAGPLDLLVRVETESSMQVPLVLAPPAVYLERFDALQIGVGAYYGVLVALLLYNLILYVSVRDRNFLWYVLYVGAFGLMLLCLNGFAFQWFWPGWPALANVAIVVSIPLAMMAMLQFSRSFLDLRRQLPRADLVMKGLIGVTALLLLSAFVLPYRPVVHAETVMTFPVILAILGSALALWRRYAPARFFLMAWALLLAGAVVFAAVSLGMLPKTLLTEYSLQIGSAAEMILLSFALAYRINVLKAENERIQSEAREQLEARVRARTAELDAAMSRLEDANRQLEDFSRRDGLTGAFNRRHLDQLLANAITRARADGQWLSLLMIDVDHFKRINDSFGHLAGDDCLRAVADLLREAMGEDDAQLARFGGEEFAVLAPGLDRHGANRLAEALRAAVARQPIRTEGTEIPLTISIGIASREPGAREGGEEMLRGADAALYAAKERGRNCVVAAG